MLVFISGFGGSGKDTIAKLILESDLDIKKLVNYTTRSPRNGETEGVDYHFISESEFVHRSYLNDWLEARAYNHFVGNSVSGIVRYATPRYDDFDTNYLCWGSVEQILKIKKFNKDPNIFWIHLESTPLERIERMIRRATNDEMVVEACRRVYQDHEDFKEVERYFNPDKIIKNPDGTSINVTAKLITYEIRERMLDIV